MKGGLIHVSKYVRGLSKLRYVASDRFCKLKVFEATKGTLLNHVIFTGT